MRRFCENQGVVVFGQREVGLARGGFYRNCLLMVRPGDSDGYRFLNIEKLDWLAR